MRTVNFDIIETTSGDLFLKLSSRFYKLTGDPKAESHARNSIDTAQFGKQKKTGNLREWVGEATQLEKKTVDIEDLKMMADVFDTHDISPGKIHWGEAYADAVRATTHTYDTYTDEDGVTIRTPKVKPLEDAFFDGS